MASKFRLRYIFKPLVKLIARGSNKIGVTANIATWMMLSFAILSAASLLLFGNLLLFGIFVFLCGIFDGVDGAISRLTNTDSPKGGFFDSTMDRVSEFVIFMGILLYYWTESLFGILDMKIVVFFCLFFSIMISYSRARAEIIYQGDYDIGLMARSERLFYLVITSIYSFFYDFMTIFIFIFLLLAFGTFLFRYFKIKKIIENNADKIEKTE